MKAFKKLWPRIANGKVLVTFGAVLIAIAGIDIWMRNCNDINIWGCMSWIGKIASAIPTVGLFGWAFFVIGKMAIDSIHTPRKRI